ncbi:MAG: hypothetical protein HY587_07990 [Candidatus Omnitrophica bacterium]|nr:hypothetical protein [Candidatus Omnitrophota bacterium]
MSFEKLEEKFPNLKRESYRITSEATTQYNCIAWAIEKDDLVWWPDTMDQYSWPQDIVREEGLDAFISFFRRLGYEVCDDDLLERGFEKIALYVDENARGTHAAKQLKNGKWTSKLGPDEDIEHDTLIALVGAKLGVIGQILKCPVTS